MISFDELAEDLSRKYELSPELCRSYLINILHNAQGTPVDWIGETLDPLAANVVQASFSSFVGFRGEKLTEQQG